MLTTFPKCIHRITLLCEVKPKHCFYNIKLTSRKSSLELEAENVQHFCATNQLSKPLTFCGLTNLLKQLLPTL